LILILLDNSPEGEIMPKIVIYAPFKRIGRNIIGGSDIHQILYGIFGRGKEDLDVVKVSTKVNNQNIDGIQVVFKGEEKDQVGLGDVLIVNGHGGTGKYTDICDNSGQEIKLTEMMDRLKMLGCDRASVAIFFICFSAEDDHAAPVYKAKYKEQSVYGSKKACEAKDFFGRMSRSTPVTFASAVWTDPGAVFAEM
jgi:hypothetical protein